MNLSNYIYQSSDMTNLSTQDATGAVDNILDYVKRNEPTKVDPLTTSSTDEEFICVIQYWAHVIIFNKRRNPSTGQLFKI